MLLLVIGEGVIGGVGAGELRLTARLRDCLGAQDRRLLRWFTVERRASVNVPMKRAFEVFS